MRALILILTLGLQALASGGGLLRFCTARQDFTRCAHCPDASKNAVRQKAMSPTTSAAVGAAPCCQLERLEPATSAAVHEAGFTFLAALPAPADDAGFFLGPTDPSGSAFLIAVPRSQGPPLYLKIQTLLI